MQIKTVIVVVTLLRFMENVLILFSSIFFLHLVAPSNTWQLMIDQWKFKITTGNEHLPAVEHRLHRANNRKNARKREKFTPYKLCVIYDKLFPHKNSVIGKTFHGSTAHLFLFCFYVRFLIFSPCLLNEIGIYHCPFQMMSMVSTSFSFVMFFSADLHWNWQRWWQWCGLMWSSIEKLLFFLLFSIHHETRFFFRFLHKLQVMAVPHSIFHTLIKGARTL